MLKKIWVAILASPLCRLFQAKSFYYRSKWGKSEISLFLHSTWRIVAWKICYQIITSLVPCSRPWDLAAEKQKWNSALARVGFTFWTVHVIHSTHREHTFFLFFFYPQKYFLKLRGCSRLSSWLCQDIAVRIFKFLECLVLGTINKIYQDIYSSTHRTRHLQSV